MNTKLNNAIDELVETYILHYGFEFKYGEFYECPGGHIWHWCDLVDTIENMSPPDLYNLCFLAEKDRGPLAKMNKVDDLRDDLPKLNPKKNGKPFSNKVEQEEYFDLTRGA